MHVIYILRGKKDQYLYTGLTKNLRRRLREHNTGRVKPTKAHTPLEVVYVEKFKTRKEARFREKFFKSGSGRELRNSILNNIPR